MGRLERVNQQLKREISLILQRDLGDPRFEFVTITQAEISKDLRHAKIYFSVLGNQLKVKDAQAGFENAKGKIRKYIGDRIKMRFTPELLFIYDQSLEISERIERTLQEIRDESESYSEDH